jgi:hypothetical protein
LPSPTAINVTATSQADSSKSSTASVSVTSDINVSVATNPPNIGSVATNALLQLAANISSAGHPDLTVNWSVNGIQNGNSADGIIATTGASTAQYTAPAVLPAQFTITISATSVADPSKKATVSLIIAGVIDSATQLIGAANGGTISLPDGSSVTIPAGAFASDETVTLSLVSVPQQPPSGLIVAVGPALVLSASPSPLNTSSGNIQFVLNAGSNTGGLSGSIAMADLIDSTGDNFLGVAGSFDTTSHLSNISFPAGLMNGTSKVVVSMGNLAPPYLQSAALKRVLNALAANVVPPAPGQLSWNGSAWVPFSCPSPNSKVLVLVHGMASSVQGAFADSSGNSCVEAIRAAGKYDQVVGLNYSYPSDIALSGGKDVANFLNTVAACPGITQLDVEAHSEGGPVSAYGVTLAQPSTQALIKNLVGLGSPWLGTPVAQAAVTIQGWSPLLTVLLNYNFPMSVLLTSSQTAQTLLNAPFAAQLQPGSALLNSIQQNLPKLAAKMVLVAGTQPPLYHAIVGKELATMFPNVGNDGIIGVNSALAIGTNFNVKQRLEYPLSHTHLECDPNVISDVGNQVNSSGIPAPGQAQLSVIPTSMTFSATQGGPNPSSQTLTLNSSGAAISWTAANSQIWLKISPTNASTPSTTTISVDVTGLSAGTYNDSIAISAPSASNSVVNVPVTLQVNPMGTSVVQLTVNQLSCAPDGDLGGGDHYALISASGTASGDIGSELYWSLDLYPDVDIGSGFQSCGSWTPFAFGCQRQGGPAGTTWTGAWGNYLVGPDFHFHPVTIEFWACTTQDGPNNACTPTFSQLVTCP